MFDDWKACGVKGGRGARVAEQSVLLCPIPVGLTLRRRPGPEPPSDPAAPGAGRRARSPSLCLAVLPAVGAVGTRFFFSKTEACSLPAPLEMEVNSTNNRSTQGPSACGATLPLAASPAGLEGLPGLPSAPPDPAPCDLPFPSQEQTESPSSSEPWRPGPPPRPFQKAQHARKKSHTGEGVLPQPDRTF